MRKALLILAACSVIGCREQWYEPDSESGKPDMSLAVNQFNEAAESRGLKVKSVGYKSSDGDFLQIMLEDGTRIKIKWQDMGRSTDKAKSDLNRKMDELAGLIKSQSTQKSYLIEVSGHETNVSENPEPSQPGDAIRKYKVTKGDDVYAIAIMFNVSVQALKKLNNLTTDKPAPGTEIIIPAD